MMKKNLFFVLILMGTLSVTAQTSYVSPIDFEPYKLQLDTIRVNNTELGQFLVELEYSATQVKRSGEQIKETLMQAKEERSLIATLTSGMNDAKKSISASEKITRQQIKEFDNVLKMLDKQTNQVHKTMRVAKEARHALENGLEQEKQTIRREQKALNERLRAISDVRKQWDNMSSHLSACSAELDKKEATLKQWSETNKQQAELLKTEIKTTKEQIKAAK